ncbi:glyoxylate/succinic semialdehyde reductase 1-like [Mangifera indica]|uniref:glyoxylate/succinic semialdehyde reductase 1-like n=1 Tax=Mangifera indica TaxID=29780 RepID=UPI001CF943BD|nr:glyoxylate/succinic semialdehyde reductase 1-like [Mangifera indica]
MEVGFLGLGIMGKAISMNLLQHGFKVTVWNRSLSKCNELVAHGATVGESPAEVVKKCKITFGMLADPPAALSVVFDKGGILEQICPGKGYIDMSTVDPETSTKISQAISAKGGHFLEAPVSGSKQPAETGQLVILSAGEKALYDDAIPALNVIGKKSFFLGEIGNGAKMKLVVNMIMGCMMNAFSEGLVLSEKSGLDPRSLLEVLDLGGIANPMFRGKGPGMLQGNHSPAFPLKHQQKDIRLALALGDENAVSMPVAAAANETYKRARNLGLGDLDFSAVYEAVKGPN